MCGEEVTPAVPAGILVETEYDPGLSFDSAINVGICERITLNMNLMVRNHHSGMARFLYMRFSRWI